MTLTQYKPIAYQCSDYNSFLMGLCIDCGLLDEKFLELCAVLGEKAIADSPKKLLTTVKNLFNDSRHLSILQFVIQMNNNFINFFVFFSVNGYQFPINSAPPLAIDIPVPSLP